jgi:hypothetical protein
MIFHNDLWLVVCGGAISVLFLLVGWFNKQLLLQGMLNILVDLVFLTSIKLGFTFGPHQRYTLVLLQIKAIPPKLNQGSHQKMMGASPSPTCK